MRTLASLVILLSLGATTAHALNVGPPEVLLFDGGAPPMSADEFGYSDAGGDPQRIAIRVNIDQPADVTGLTFLGGYYGANTPQDDAFSLKIFGDVQGRPDSSTLLAQLDHAAIERTATGYSFFNFIDIYSYRASFEAIHLPGAGVY